SSRPVTGCRSGQGGLEVVDEVGLFPRKEVALGLAPEVAIGRRLPVDRLVEPEMGADAARGQAAELVDAEDRLLDPVVSDGAGPVRVDVERKRLRHADRIGELDRAAPGE